MLLQRAQSTISRTQFLRPRVTRSRTIFLAVARGCLSLPASRSTGRTGLFSSWERISEIVRSVCDVVFSMQFSQVQAPLFLCGCVICYPRRLTEMQRPIVVVLPLP